MTASGGTWVDGVGLCSRRHDDGHVREVERVSSAGHAVACRGGDPHFHAVLDHVMGEASPVVDWLAPSTQPLKTTTVYINS